MRYFLKILSFGGLALTVAPAALVFAGALSWRMHAALMLAGAALWFATAPFWMRRAADAA